MNAINKKTFDELFPDVELEESTEILQNFDKRLIKPIGSFRCFLRWKDHKYRVKFEVMGIETPNLLSRETTFLMGILKKCLSVETAPIIRFPHYQFQVIQFRPRKQFQFQLHLRPWKEYLAIQLRPRKVYIAIQFRPRKQLQFRLHLRPWKIDLR